MKTPSTDRQLSRAKRWLHKHGLEVTPTPLLAARLAARRHSMTGLVVAGVLVVLVFLVLQGWWLVTSRSTTSEFAALRLVVLVAFMLSAVVIRGLAMRWVTRSERRLAATLTVRVAHTPRADLWSLMGTRRLAITAVLYGASTAVAVAALWLGRSTEAKTMAVVLLAAIAAFLGLTGMEIAELIRRPALADDEVSLRVDDLLRTADLQASTLPLLPVMMVSVTAFQGGQYQGWLLLCAMALNALLVIEILWSSAVQRPASPLGSTPAHQQ